MRATLLAATAAIALSQAHPVATARAAPAEDRNAPVNFQADEAQYDREAGIVTVTGHVEAWQNGRTLRADKIVFDRNTDVLAASGNVVLQEPDGQILFSDYAELTQDMKSGILKGVRSLLAQNGQLVANGARRTEAKLNELTRPVYTTCNVCKEDAGRPPLWDIRAREAIQNIEVKRIEYQDVVIDLHGIPVLYLPYLTHPDPSAKRASGLLPPSFGAGSRHLGPFAKVPYYFVLDDQSDLIVTPMLTSKAGEAVFTDYRRLFNDGRILAKGSIANGYGALQGHLFGKGDFAIDETWRWGFDIQRASNATYLRNFGIEIAPNFLTSQVFVEGYGQGAYARGDVRFYQGITTTQTTSKLPVVLPRVQYSFVGQPDAWGGRLGVEAGAFNVLRAQGTSTQRSNLGVAWNRPFRGPVGDLWTVSLNVDNAVYQSHGLNRIPNYARIARAQATQTMPTLSVKTSWPLARDAGEWGRQVIEPIVKVMASPRSRSYADGRIPNEDSLDVEFTDATLFERNRFAGIDRMEGGLRGAAALHAAWLFPGGAKLDGLFGQSYRLRTEQVYANSSGLRGTDSDYVGRVSVTPSSWLDITTRARLDHDTQQVRFADSGFSLGDSQYGFGAGYLYASRNPYAGYDAAVSDAATIALTRRPRHEVNMNLHGRIDANWRVSATVTRDLRLGKESSDGINATYEDECLIFDTLLYHRYTSLNADHGDSGLLFNVTLKSVGEFGFHAE